MRFVWTRWFCTASSSSSSRGSEAGSVGVGRWKNEWLYAIPLPDLPRKIFDAKAELVLGKTARSDVTRPQNDVQQHGSPPQDREPQPSSVQAMTPALPTGYLDTTNPLHLQTSKNKSASPQHIIRINRPPNIVLFTSPQRSAKPLQHTHWDKAGSTYIVTHVPRKTSNSTRPIQRQCPVSFLPQKRL